MAKVKAQRDWWGEWEDCSLTPEQVDHIEATHTRPKLPARILRNRLYEVWVTEVDSPGNGWPPMLWLSIKRRDRRAIHDWRELQRIKSELCGPECEAVELYPAESRHVDSANQYHLWVLRDGVRFPFGYDSRLVVGPDVSLFPGDKSEQRPFGPTHQKPDDTSWSKEAARAQQEGA